MTSQAHSNGRGAPGLSGSCSVLVRASPSLLLFRGNGGYHGLSNLSVIQGYLDKSVKVATATIRRQVRQSIDADAGQGR